ncbi:hypothetical protein PCE1_001159 [Barthelona sp. PCE]
MCCHFKKESKDSKNEMNEGCQELKTIVGNIIRDKQIDLSSNERATKEVINEIAKRDGLRDSKLYSQLYLWYFANAGSYTDKDLAQMVSKVRRRFIDSAFGGGMLLASPIFDSETSSRIFSPDDDSNSWEVVSFSNVFEEHNDLHHHIRHAIRGKRGAFLKLCGFSASDIFFSDSWESLLIGIGEYIFSLQKDLSTAVFKFMMHMINSCTTNALFDICSKLLDRCVVGNADLSPNFPNVCMAILHGLGKLCKYIIILSLESLSTFMTQLFVFLSNKQIRHLAFIVDPQLSFFTGIFSNFRIQNVYKEQLRNLYDNLTRCKTDHIFKLEILIITPFSSLHDIARLPFEFKTDNTGCTICNHCSKLFGLRMSDVVSSLGKTAIDVRKTRALHTLSRHRPEEFLTIDFWYTFVLPSESIDYVALFAHTGQPFVLLPDNMIVLLNSEQGHLLLAIVDSLYQSEKFRDAISDRYFVTLPLHPVLLTLQYIGSILFTYVGGKTLTDTTVIVTIKALINVLRIRRFKNVNFMELWISMVSQISPFIFWLMRVYMFGKPSRIRSCMEQHIASLLSCHNLLIGLSEIIPFIKVQESALSCYIMSLQDIIVPTTQRASFAVKLVNRSMRYTECLGFGSDFASFKALVYRMPPDLRSLVVLYMFLTERQNFTEGSTELEDGLTVLHTFDSERIAEYFDCDDKVENALVTPLLKLLPHHNNVTMFSDVEVDFLRTTILGFSITDPSGAPEAFDFTRYFVDAKKLEYFTEMSNNEHYEQFIGECRSFDLSDCAVCLLLDAAFFFKLSLPQLSALVNRIGIHLAELLSPSLSLLIDVAESLYGMWTDCDFVNLLPVNKHTVLRE